MNDSLRWWYVLNDIQPPRNSHDSFSIISTSSSHETSRLCYVARERVLDLPNGRSAPRQPNAGWRGTYFEEGNTRNYMWPVLRRIKSSIFDFYMSWFSVIFLHSPGCYLWNKAVKKIVPDQKWSRLKEWLAAGCKKPLLAPASSVCLPCSQIGLITEVELILASWSLDNECPLPADQMNEFFFYVALLDNFCAGGEPPPFRLFFLQSLNSLCHCVHFPLLTVFFFSVTRYFPW